MSYRFGKRSLAQLETCDERIQDILSVVIEIIDISVLEGHRSKKMQNLYYSQGKSKLQYPRSKHNSYPSKAVDIVPYFKNSPHIRWNDRESFVYLAGIVKGVATLLGYKIRWGGDWDSDNELRDQTFFDLPHFEIVD